MKPTLKVRKLNKCYGNHIILNNIDLDVYSGSAFALLGPNGSGKTTLMKIILGIVHPSSLNCVSIEHGMTIGYMPQQPNFPVNMKVCELFKVFEKLRKRTGIYLERLMLSFGVNAFYDKSIKELSGGMRQKVNIVQAFMFDNSLLLLDEPTLGLDPYITFLFKNLIKERKENGATILFTSHIMSEVQELADELALLVDGHIHAKNSPRIIMDQANTTSLEEALRHYWMDKYEKI